MMLADLGATVIKIERPESGDDSRGWGPPYAEDGQSTYFHSVNRNKNSVVLDLKLEKDRRKARTIAMAADIVIENFPTGTMAKFNLDYATLSQNRPDLIYCSITGFGTSDEAAAMPGYDLLVQAVGGLMSITGQPQEPTKVGVALVDVITGLHAVMAIQAALIQRQRTGRGQHVELSLLSSLLSAMVNQSAAWAVGGVVPHAMGNAHPSVVPYQVFSSADADFVVAVGNDQQFGVLAAVVGHQEWISDERFSTNTARIENRVALCALLEPIFITRSAADWVAALTRLKVPAGRINSVSEAFALAESLGLEPIKHIDGIPTISHPVRYSGFDVDYRYSPPTLGSTDV
jgi:crotonobetainyl-CoA:carnitine CoA-transferase CaiB-like acyl-CoA transferase